MHLLSTGHGAAVGHHLHGVPPAGLDERRVNRREPPLVVSAREPIREEAMLRAPGERDVTQRPLDANCNETEASTITDASSRFIALNDYRGAGIGWTEHER